MTEKEWMELGYSSGVIEVCEGSKVSFEEVYRDWFRMKRNVIRPQSLDRIECTWNRHYSGSCFVKMFVSDISDSDIINFLNGILVREGRITYKEFSRILQIVNNVLVYARDLHYSGVSLHDWEHIKRVIPSDKIDSSVKIEDAVRDKYVQELIYEVVHNKIYKVKQNASLCLCMNFYLGLRVGELASLTFDDFDFERNVVRIYKTESKFYDRDDSCSRVGSMCYRVVDSVKTVHSVREIPLLPQVKRFYWLIKKNHEDNHYNNNYLAYDGDDVILVRSLDRVLRRLCMLCDIPYFNTHMIRKTFSTRLHFSGVPTRVISDLLGHSEISTTENSYILSYGSNYQKIYDYMLGGLKYE